jgi:hypothetical protein
MTTARELVADALQEPSPDFGEWYIDAAELLAKPDPGPTPWLIENLIVDQALVACVGRWKTTKSYGLLDLCIAVATGRPAFGALAVPKRGPVVFVNEESGEAALWRRLDALCRGRAIDRDELREHLYVAANARVKLDDPGWQNELSDLGRAIHPRLFVFDPLARMKGIGRKENDQDQMDVVIDFWRELRTETKAAVALVQHTGHQGDHMRGTSDLETAWETRLAWVRDGQNPVVTIKSEHREAEAAEPIQYRIAWDGQTRTMRFDLEHDPIALKVVDYLREHPDASANEVYKEVGGNRKDVLAAVKQHKEQGGSNEVEPPRNHPPQAALESGTSSPPVRAAGTTTEEPGTNGTEPHLSEDEIERIRQVFLDSEPDPMELEHRGARVVSANHGGGVSTAMEMKRNDPQFSISLSVSPLMRRCYVCGEERPAEEFAVDRSKASGRKSICKACDREKTRRKYVERRRGELSEYRPGYRPKTTGLTERLLKERGET